MNEPKKKLNVLLFSDTLNYGGVEMLLINLLQHHDEARVHFDIMTLDSGFAYALESRARELGANIYRLQGIWLYTMKDYLRYCMALDLFFKNHSNYDAVHINTGSKNFPILIYAKKYGVAVRIAHSHSTGFQTQRKTKIIIGNIMKTPLKIFATHYLACSEYAAQWLFKKSTFMGKQVKIIRNGIDLERYHYEPMQREEMRAALGIDKEAVIGCIGRFVPQKNCRFIVDVFELIYGISKNSILLWAGDGEQRKEIEDYAKSKKIDTAIHFLGMREDVNLLLQAMDVILMPSLYEGFPVVAIEAQASGLPCALSDTITKEAKLLPETVFLSLTASKQEWADTVLSLIGTVNRETCIETLNRKGFDIQNMIEELITCYQGKNIKAGR